MADVSVFTVSRALVEWQSQGILAKSRGKIVLRAPKRLGLVEKKDTGNQRGARSDGASECEK
jgi:hypothetical protein